MERVEERRGEDGDGDGDGGVVGRAAVSSLGVVVITRVGYREGPGSDPSSDSPTLGDRVIEWEGSGLGLGGGSGQGLWQCGSCCQWLGCLHFTYRRAITRPHEMARPLRVAVEGCVCFLCY